jgi:S1-C subfamily serine protease
MLELEQGQTVTVTVERDGKRTELEVTLGAR